MSQLLPENRLKPADEFKLRIGSLELSSPILLAPLSGYTDYVFRQLLYGLGGLGLAVSELVHARSLLEQRGKALQIIKRCSPDEPLAVQLFGGEATEMAEAARWVEAAGYPVVDINMGCPAPKVVRIGAGAALLNDVDRATRLVEQVVKAVKIPVTVKMRLGWDPEHFTAPLLAKRFEELGVSAIVVHGRWRVQGFSGKVDLERIKMVVESVKEMPVIGNGGVKTPLDAALMMRQCRCKGVSIGRAAFMNPWIFKHTIHYLQTGILLPSPSVRELAKFMEQHFELLTKQLGEKVACLRFRKIAIMYTKGIRCASTFHRAVQKVTTREEFYAALTILKSDLRT